MFPATERLTVPLLELVDFQGLPTMARGRGAPLELAIYLNAVLSDPYDFRGKHTEIVTTVRELSAFLFGDGFRTPGKWNPASKWPRVRQAALNADRLSRPDRFPDGRPGLRLLPAETFGKTD